jgi:hypothetical protein
VKFFKRTPHIPLSDYGQPKLLSPEFNKNALRKEKVKFVH